MERPNKYEKPKEDKRPEQKRTNYVRASRVISIVTPAVDNHQSATTNNEEENPLDLVLTKEVYEAVEDLGFIANQMRSASHYEEVLS
jgi:hypothetical protein